MGKRLPGQASPSKQDRSGGGWDEDGETGATWRDAGLWGWRGWSGSVVHDPTTDLGIRAWRLCDLLHPGRNRKQR